MKPTLDLKRALLSRISLFAVGLFFLAAGVMLHQTGERIRTDIQRTGSVMQQLISNQTARASTAFERSFREEYVAALRDIGEVVPFCIRVQNLYDQTVADQCFRDTGKGHPLKGLLAWAVGRDAEFRGAIGDYPGIKLADIIITPNYDWEAANFSQTLLYLAGITVGVLFLNVLVYVPVRRALQPTEAILEGLGRMEAGDLSVRLPSAPLIELQRISAVFNHLADRLQTMLEERQQLALRLLGVREEERRHLARELHDEFGQCLTSIQAEAAFAKELARDSLPALLPSAEAISRTTTQMLQTLQQMLRQLRPVGLEEFGLRTALAHLVEGWQRRSGEQCEYALEMSGNLDGLDDILNVTLYRIAQEALTNAARHAQARHVWVSLARDAAGGCLHLSVENDGLSPALDEAPSGMGLIGMRERVLALAGTIAIRARAAGGLSIVVTLPDTCNAPVGDLGDLSDLGDCLDPHPVGG